MEKNQEYSAQFKNEAAVIRQYVQKLGETVGKNCEVRGILERDEDGVPSKAWHIIINPRSESEVEEKVLIIDWDDTFDYYTGRKDKFHEKLTAFLLEDKSVDQEAFVKVCKIINKAARILPENGVHPEHYTPKLELIAVSMLLNDLNQDGSNKLLEAVTKSSSIEENEVSARKFIESEILPQLRGYVEVVEEEKADKPKNYFIEKVNQSLTLDPEGDLPKGVNKNVWDAFNETMLQPNIPEDEFENIDFPEDDRLIVATFGEASFQLEKITNSIAALIKHGSRIPDEIVVFLRGRKEPVIRKIAESYEGAKIVYVDDSLRQVEKVVKNIGIDALHAIRKGSKRSAEKPDGGIKSINMATTKLSELV